MFQRLPKPLEITLFAIMALICSLVVLLSPHKDSALFYASVPLFLVSAIMGFRRSEQKPTAEVVEVDRNPNQLEDSVL